MKFKNSKKQGDAGLGAAIGYFAKMGYTVSLPLTDSQGYDLIIDDGFSLKRVFVRTTNVKRKKSYELNLRSTGGYHGIRNRKLDKKKVDVVFAITGDWKMYFIPVDDLGGSSMINLPSKYVKFEVL